MYVTLCKNKTHIQERYGAYAKMLWNTYMMVPKCARTRQPKWFKTCWVILTKHDGKMDRNVMGYICQNDTGYYCQKKRRTLIWM